MKISHIRSQILVLPQEDPLANTPEDTSAARPIVIVRLGTDDGIEGIGVTFYGGAITASLKRAGGVGLCWMHNLEDINDARKGFANGAVSGL
jgi:L-alanine-DL-glutamate epimerase-like enolase superfamily enzyme